MNAVTVFALVLEELAAVSHKKKEKITFQFLSHPFVSEGQLYTSQ